MKTRLLLVLSLTAFAAAGLRCSEPAEDPADAAESGPDTEVLGTDAEAPGPDAEAPGPDAAQVGPDASRPDTGPKPCDPSKCAEGNICVENRCRLPCTRHTECPDGWDCRAREGKLVCVENGLPFGDGQFGAGCGTGTCAEGFLCVGVKNDPTSYCSRSPCKDDSECPGSYYCSRADVTVPDAGTVNTSLCRKRSYCAPAAGPVDCHDVDAVYIKDTKAPDGGVPGWCLKGCSGLDPNACGAGNGCFNKLCWPRSNSCNPTRVFCSRCVSSADCPPGGVCYQEGFSKERYCTAPCRANSDCTPPNLPLDRTPGTCLDTKSWGKQCFPADLGDEPDSCWMPL